MKTVLFSRY